MRKILDTLALNPKRFFLVDGFGAFITAFILFSILRPFNEYIGMSKSILTFLSIIAFALCVFSMSCFLLVKEKWKPYLKAISIGNLIYCCLTIGLIFYYCPQLTILGLIYFLIEIVVICGLVYFEMSTLTTISIFNK